MVEWYPTPATLAPGCAGSALASGTDVGMHPPSGTAITAIRASIRNLMPNLVAAAEKTAARIAPSCASILFPELTMDHRRACLQRARHRVVFCTSGNGGTIEPWGSVIGHLTAAFDLAKGRRRGRLHDIDQRRRKRGDTHQPAALPVGRMRSFLGDRPIVNSYSHGAVLVAGTHVRLCGGVIVHMAIHVNMLDRRLNAHMGHAGHVTHFSKARRDGVRTGQGKRD